LEHVALICSRRPQQQPAPPELRQTAAAPAAARSPAVSRGAWHRPCGTPSPSAGRFRERKATAGRSCRSAGHTGRLRRQWITKETIHAKTQNPALQRRRLRRRRRAVRRPGPADVTDADILNDAKTTGDVVSFGLGTQGQRYSPATQINTKTVKNLVPAWSMSFGGEKQRGQESQPVIHNGKMFVTASYSRLFAMDAKSGKKLWKYEHRLPDGIMPCCDVINRGAALYGNLVIFATLDASWSR
jgi:hypothetical protein